MLPFFLWLRGRPFETLYNSVDGATRLFKGALRIGGWSHTLANCMKSAVFLVDRWPSILDKLRALCKFFRTEPYRRHLQRVYKDNVEANAQVLLKYFTATLAKWRFETFWNVLGQLERISGFCQKYFEGVDFGKMKDAELLKTVRDACKDADLWVFISATYKWVISPLEAIRRWGMKCRCCNEERAEQGSHFRPRCPHASRKLDLAFEYIQEQAKKLLRQARLLTMREVPVQWVFLAVRQMMSIGINSRVHVLLQM